MTIRAGSRGRIAALWLAWLLVGGPWGLAWAQQAAEQEEGEEAEQQPPVESEPEEGSETPRASTPQLDSEQESSASDEQEQQAAGQEEAAPASQQAPARQSVSAPAQPGPPAAEGDAFDEEFADEEEEETAALGSEGPAGVLAAPASPSEGEPDAEPSSGEGSKSQQQGHKFPWSAFFRWDHEMTAYTLDPAAQLAYNPTYSWALTLVGGYEIDDAWSVGAMVAGSIEWTPSEDTTTLREFWFSDESYLGVAYKGIPKLWDVSFQVNPRLWLPISPPSAAVGRVLGVGGTASANRGFELSDAVSLSLGVNFYYRHWLGGSNVPRVDEPFDCQTYDTERTLVRRCDQYPGPTATRDRIRLLLEGELALFERFSVSMAFLWYWDFAAALAPTAVPVDSEPDGFVVVGDGSPTHMRGSTLFEIAVGYQVTPYLGLQLAMDTLAPHLDTDGEPENPFFNERTTLVLTANLSLHELYGQFIGGHEVGKPTSRQELVARRQRASGREDL